MAEVLSSELFSLKWNNFSNNLASGFSSHLSEKDLVDVTLAVEGHLLKAHKLILSICSPYFKNIFKENPCQHPVVILNDIKHSEVQALLKFMYEGEVNIRQEDLGVFFQVAEALQIKGLVKEEKKRLSFNDEDNDINIDTYNDEFTAKLNSNTAQIKSSIKTLVTNPLLERHKRTQDSTASTSKRKCVKPHSIDIIKTEKTSENDKVFISDNNDSDNDTNAKSNEHANILKNERIMIEQETSEDCSAYAQCFNEDKSQKAVEPVTYRLSARGRPQLVYEGYVYNLTSCSKVMNHSHYRCAEQHRGCKGKCAVISERFIPTGVNNHNHPPGYQTEVDYRKKKHMEADSI
ncbi:protein abrupt-like [Prorops nasuta]|uniref:protein abrupt-like n=1 Tax=Prorops nasuta TaxID=863751 RepID=UPI0034CDC6F3